MENFYGCFHRHKCQQIKDQRRVENWEKIVAVYMLVTMLNCSSEIFHKSRTQTLLSGRRFFSSVHLKLRNIAVSAVCSNLHLEPSLYGLLGHILLERGAAFVWDHSLIYGTLTVRVVECFISLSDHCQELMDLMETVNRWCGDGTVVYKV